ncbi:MAG: hypothetical protein KAQ94_05280 [Arcobacteraceae bacterium]|nr:hypothetical protein [Arcobacteraceae bacterium]
MIYIGGPQRTSTGYLWGIVAKYLKSNSQFKSISQLLSDDKEVFPFDVDGECMDVVQPLKDLGFNVLTIKYYENIKNKNFLYYENNFLEPKYIASKCSVFQTHKSMRMYKTHQIDKYISHYFFIHRNPLDEATSIIKAQSISKEKYQKTISSNQLSFQIRRYTNNNMNYGLYPEDLQKAFSYLRICFFNEIRFNAVDFIKYKDDNNVYEFTFENLTITDKLNEIKRIAQILSLNSDSIQIYNELEEALNNGAYWNNKGKKTNTAKEFFDIDIFYRIQLLLGDVSVLLGYTSINNLSDFISLHTTFIVVCIGLNDIEIENIKNIFNIFKKDVLIKNIVKLEEIDIEQSKKYIFCTQNLVEYRKIENIIDENSIVYPYYKALLGFEEVVFSLKSKKDIHLNKDLLESSTILWDKDSCNDDILLQKCKEFSALNSIDIKPSKDESIILLSYNQELIREFALKYIDICNIFTLIPMYNFDKPTLCELFGDKIIND